MIVAHDRRYTLDDVLAVVRGEKVELAAETAAMLETRRAEVVRYVREHRAPSYGFNRGFGHNVDQRVDGEERIKLLQENLIRSHAAGMGPLVPRDIVRAVLFVRALSLTRGASAVRPLIVETLLQMLNRGVTPCIPWYGSVGASGDLAPLSHVALVMIATDTRDGEAWYGDDETPIPACEAMRRAGIEPVQLEMKEGLALNNGTTFSTGAGILAYDRMCTLLKTASIATAMSTQVMLGSDRPFRDDLLALRPHEGARTIARWVRQLMDGSPIRETHRGFDIDGEVQDPYNLRCAPQILGTCRDLLEEARTTFEIELNSATDNPLILPQRDPLTGAESWTDIVSGGNFHAMPVAVKLYNLMQAAAIMAKLSNTRCARYVDGKKNKGLNEDVKWRDEWRDNDALLDAVSSGMMIPEYASAALANHIWGAAMPSHLFSIATDAGQEDPVSMAAGLAARLWDTLPRLADILAIELAFAAQAAESRQQAEAVPTKISMFLDEEDDHEEPLPDSDTAERSIRAEERAELRALKEVLEQRATEVMNRRLAVSRDEDAEQRAAGPRVVRVELAARHRIDPDARVLSPVCERVRARILEIFPAVTEDRYMSRELRELSRLVLEGGVAGVAADALV